MSLKIEDDSEPVSYANCSLCYAIRPADVSPREHGKIEVAVTREGLIVWCIRHEVPILHVTPDLLASWMKKVPDCEGQHSHGEAS